MITIYKQKTRYANDYYEFVADTEADIANADHTHNDDAIYTAIQSLFVYDEPTKTLNIIPYGGGS